MGASGAVGELVFLPAGGAGKALEYAGGHVGNAAVGLDGHGVALHVDFAGDIKGGVGAVKGVLAPGLGYLTVDHGGVLVDGGPGTGSARCERDVHGSSVGNGVGDERLVDVDPAAGGAPDDHGDVLARVVSDLVDVVTVVADPGLAVVGLGVGSDKDAESGKDGIDIGEESVLNGGDEVALGGNGNSVAEGSRGHEAESRGGETHLDVVVLRLAEELSVLKMFWESVVLEGWYKTKNEVMPKRVKAVNATAKVSD